MPKMYFIDHGLSLRDNRVNAFTPNSWAGHWCHLQTSIPLISVNEDLSVILLEVGTSPNSKNCVYILMINTTLRSFSYSPLFIGILRKRKNTVGRCNGAG